MASEQIYSGAFYINLLQYKKTNSIESVRYIAFLIHLTIFKEFF
jgi:hypothetical protein